MGGNTQFLQKGNRWIECQSETIRKHIHHALCGHGGEQCMVINKQEILVDGYDPETSTIYQFYRCKWHRCPCTSPDPAGITDLRFSKDKYQKTLHLEARIQNVGYDIVSVWECEDPEPTRLTQALSDSKLEKKFVAYPHYIVYDFEATLRPRSCHRTQDLMINCSHFPVSITINDSLTQEPIFIENCDPELLISEFVEGLIEGKSLFLKKFGIDIQWKMLTPCQSKFKRDGGTGLIKFLFSDSTVESMTLTSFAG